MRQQQYLAIMKIIEQRTPELAAPVLEFARSVSAIYEKDSNFPINDVKIVTLHGQAEKAVRDWIHLVLMADCFCNQREWATCTVNLPQEEAVFDVEWKISGLDPADSITPNELTFKTPIGSINYFMYKAITTIPNNPVEVLFKYYNEQLQKCHYMVRRKLGKNSDGVLNMELLKKANIHDVLDIHALDSILTHVHEWFNKAESEQDDIWK